MKRYVKWRGSWSRVNALNACTHIALTNALFPPQQHHTQCDGKCVICDSYVRPSTLVRICDECTYTSHLCDSPPLSLFSFLSYPCLPFHSPNPFHPPLSAILTGNYGSYEGRCVICGGPGISDAYYCRECTQEEKDRDGCPKIVNLGASKTDLFYERKKYGFKRYVLLSLYMLVCCVVGVDG